MSLDLAKAKSSLLDISKGFLFNAVKGIFFMKGFNTPTGGIYLFLYPNFGNMKTYIFLTALVIGLWASGAKAQTSLQQANRQYAMMAYTKAIELYEQALKENLKDTTKVNTLIKLGHSYHQVRDTPNAERVFRSLLGEGKPCLIINPIAICIMPKHWQVMANTMKQKKCMSVIIKHNKKISGEKNLQNYILT